METWVSSGPQGKTEPEVQRWNFQCRWCSDYLKGREKLRTLEGRYCVPTVYWPKQNHTSSTITCWEEVNWSINSTAISTEIALWSYCNNTGLRREVQLNPSATEFSPKLTAVEIARFRFQKHYRCTFLPSYQLYYYVEKKSKCTCINCTPTDLVDLSSEGVDVLINDIKEHLPEIETINNLLTKRRKSASKGIKYSK